LKELANYAMDEMELTAWLNALAALGFIGPWFWVKFGAEPGQRGRLCYLIDGNTYSRDSAVKLIRDFEAAVICGVD
jgi:hypothetical protein